MIFSTSKEYHDSCGGYHEYIRGCPVHQRDIMSKLRDVMSTSEEYHKYIGRISWGSYN